MASTQEQHNISETAPHFFKFLHDGSIQQAKLKVPERFVSKHGKDISDPVLLKDPSGTEWRVKLTKCCSTGAWSLDGLREFMEYYSLQFGHFLLFRYEGRSTFRVIICDKSASEIEYPVGDKNASVQLQAGKSNGKEPSKVSEASRTRFNGACSENHKRKSCSYSGFEDVVGGGFMASGTSKTLAASKKSRALQMADSFKSTKPFFSVVMQPSYVSDRFRMNVPLSITAKYFLKDCDSIHLRVSNGGTWRVKYMRYESRACSTPRVEFNVGWKAFAQDNKLVAGDVCVFEVNTGTDSSLEVSIYPSCEDSNSHDTPRMKVPKIEDTCDDSSLGRASLTPILLISMEEQYQYGPYFYQALQHDFSNHLKIPQECVRHLGIVPQNSRIKGPSKRFWDVSVEEIGTDLYFQQGWSDFAHHHSLKEKDLLLFKYCGASQFSVKIFSQNGVEEKFNLAEEEEEAILVKEEPVYHEPKHKRAKASSPYEAAAIEFMSKSTSPCFLVVMSPSYVEGHKLTVPAEFAREHLEGEHSVKLQVGGRRQAWSVRINHGPRATFMYGGWIGFAKYNELSEGDVCVFKLVGNGHGNEPVLEVTVFN